MGGDVQIDSLTQIKWSGVRWFAALAFAAMGCAGAGAAPVVNGAYYADSRTVSCGNKEECFVTAGVVPSGKQLLITRVNCVSVFSNSNTVAPEMSYILFGHNTGGGSHPSPPNAFFIPSLISHNGGIRMYGFNSQTSRVFTAGTSPQIYFALFSGTPKINNIQCTFFGELMPAVS
jgi:hypothetical protein